MNAIISKVLRNSIRANQPLRARTAIVLGAPINRQDRFANDGHNDFHIVRAAYYRCNTIANDLIKAGVNVNATCEHGHTPLIVVSSRHNVEMVKALLQAGADVNRADNDGRTALMEACNCADAETALLLIASGANVNAADHEGKTALIYALNIHAQWKFKEDSTRNKDEAFATLIEQLIQRSNVNWITNEGQSALMIAILHGQFHVIQSLLKANADVTLVDKLGRTALCLVREEQQAAESLNQRYQQIVEMLVEAEKNYHMSPEIQQEVEKKDWKMISLG